MVALNISIFECRSYVVYFLSVWWLFFEHFPIVWLDIYQPGDENKLLRRVQGAE
jgi:hypothetical protein